MSPEVHVSSAELRFLERTFERAADCWAVFVMSSAILVEASSIAVACRFRANLRRSLGSSSKASTC